MILEPTLLSMKEEGNSSENLFIPGDGDFEREMLVHGILDNPFGVDSKTTGEISVRDAVGNEVLREVCVYHDENYSRIQWSAMTYNKISSQ